MAKRVTLDGPRYALVTGGSRGIGRAVCLRLVQMGYRILFTYQHNEQEALRTEELIKAEGGECQMLRFDVCDGAQCEEQLGGWLRDNPTVRLEVLVNNAGVRDDNLFLLQSYAQWQRVISVTLDGFFHVTPHALRRMIAQRFGRIINMASLSGLEGVSSQTAYSAAKGGLISATKALAKEVARRGITVNALAPGFIESDMTSDLPHEELRQLIPMRRMGKAEEVAAAVAFFASEEASYITGQVLSINGGLYT